MDDLFINFNCDKGSYCVYDYEKKITHKYSVFYEKYLKKNKKKKLSILELGSHEGKGIASFYFFFPNANFYGANINPFQMKYTSKRITELYVDVSCEEIVDNLANHINEDLDLIIDDASHNLKDILLALPILFRKLKQNGFYVIEDADQFKVYTQMKKEALAILNGKMITTANALTQLMRLQQITCVHFKSDDGVIQELKSNRLDELVNVLGEIEGKVVIWAHWQSDVRQIIKAVVEEFGENSFVDYYGLTPQEDRQQNIKRFQEDDACRFFIGTPQTGGYGITLTAASNMIYYSNGYDLEKRQQSEARIDRIGQNKPMTYIDIICEDTVDERIVKALRKKVNIASQVMGEELKAWI